MSTTEYVNNRNEILSAYLKNVQQCVSIAKNNQNFSKMTPAQQEVTLLNAKVDDRNIIDFMNSIKEDNESSKLNLAKLNKKIKMQNNEITTNNGTLESQKDSIKLQSQKDKLSQIKLKNSDKLKDETSIWYIALMVLLVIILLGELYAIIFFLKKNNE